MLSRADGSARWSQQDTTVTAAVYGPLETTSGKQLPDRANVEVVFKPRSGLAGRRTSMHTQ
jgi:exosome complex component RRP46